MVFCSNNAHAAALLTLETIYIFADFCQNICELYMTFYFEAMPLQIF
jgi:hypothetical protein